MDYQIAFTPELGLNPADLVTDWNAADENRVIAEARLASLKGNTYDPLLLGTIAVLGSIGIGVATNAIYDPIKRVIIKRGPHKHMHISQIDHPDGTHVLVVDIEEKE